LMQFLSAFSKKANMRIKMIQFYDHSKLIALS
jgi:hypothetical protein